MFEFEPHWKESGQTEVSIGGVPGNILQKLIEYCYIGKIAIDSACVEELTKASSMLQFSEVEMNCTEFYAQKLCASNCLGVREFADQHNLVRLREMAHEFVLENFVQVSQCDEFYQLNVEQLSELLSDDDLNAQGEKNVLNALMNWLKHDVDGRKASFAPLLDYVRSEHIKDLVSN